MSKYSSYFTGKNISLLLVAILLIYLIAVIIRRFVFPILNNNSNYVNNKEFISQDSSNNNNGSSSENLKGTADILFFYADWCPHCKQAKPEWSKFKEEYSEKVVNGYKLNLVDVNCTSELGEPGELIKTYNVEGFPSVKMKANGKIIDFDAKVTKDNLTLFTKKML